MAPFTPEEFEKRMKALAFQYGDDPRELHALMDRLMAYQLENLGFDAGVDVFRDTAKFYV